MQGCKRSPLVQTASASPPLAGPIVGIAQTLELILQLQQARSLSLVDNGDIPGHEGLVSRSAIAAELGQLYRSKLPLLDPLHTRFYACEAARLLPLLEACIAQ